MHVFFMYSVQYIIDLLVFRTSDDALCANLMNHTMEASQKQEFLLDVHSTYLATNKSDCAQIKS